MITRYRWGGFVAASYLLTQQRLGRLPTQPDLLADLEQEDYFGIDVQVKATPRNGFVSGRCFI